MRLAHDKLPFLIPSPYLIKLNFQYIDLRAITEKFQVISVVESAVAGLLLI